MKIIPDKIFMLNIADSISFEKLKEKLFLGVGAQFQNGHEMNQIAKNAITEYRVNIQGVKEQFLGSITEVEANKPEEKILEEIARILFLKTSNSPKKPPKIILMGPPGVECQTHAVEIASKYKLINLDVDQLCKDWIRRQGDDPNGLELR